MTTLTASANTNTVVSNNTTEIHKLAITAIASIEAKVKTTDWVLNVNLTIDPEYLRFKINELSLNQKKKLKNYSFGAMKKGTRASINKFNHFLHKRVFMYVTPAPSYNFSAREIEIQKSRAKYVAARDLAISLYNEYEIKKGTYYKK